MRTQQRATIWLFLLGTVFGLSLWATRGHAAHLAVKTTSTRTPTRTVTITPTATVSPTVTATPTEGDTPTPSSTPTDTLTPTVTYTPWPAAPLCLDHSVVLFHTLWDSARGCHYDHEHGANPFTGDVAAAFPGFDLFALLCGTQISHCVPSSPMENTHKHGGHKWQVILNHPHACEGYEGSTYGVDAAAIQFHAFGDYEVEMETAVHSALALVRECSLSNPSDKGYIFVDQHVNYGQRVSGYQGLVLPYPDSPTPSYPSGLSPYFTIDCVSCGAKKDSRAAILAANSNSTTTWTSEPDQDPGSRLFQILFRSRDTYQVLNRTDLVYPFAFLWLCSNDNGDTYAALAGCRYNNSSTSAHEIYGIIPAEWDNLAGFDTDPEVGRITADGYVTHFGSLNPSCSAPGPDCHPLKLVRAFVGFYGSLLIENKEIQFTPAGLPERDIYFCGGVVCSETAPGAGASGWIGAEN